MPNNPTYKDIAKLGKNAKVFYNYLSSNGYSPVEISGLVSNFMHESGGGSKMDINPSAIGDDGAAVGAAQWRDERRRNLENFARAKGSSIYDPLTQAEFVHKELSTSHSSVRERLRNAKDAKSAMEVVLNHYEVPAKQHRTPGSDSYNSRLSYAKNLIYTEGDKNNGTYWNGPYVEGEGNKAWGGLDIPKERSPELKGLTDNFYGFVYTLKQKFPNLRITSSYRPGAKTAQGKPSRHGLGEAIDIGAEHTEVYDYLWNNAEGLSLMNKYGVGIIDERSKEMQKKTKASGPHFHLGMDNTQAPKVLSRAKELGFNLDDYNVSPTPFTNAEQPAYAYGWQSDLDPNSEYGKTLIENLKSQTSLQDAQRDAMMRDTMADERKVALIKRQQEKDFIVAQTLATKLNFVERNNNNKI